MAHFPSTLYWLVDKVPRPDWKRDYPAAVQKIFAGRLADAKSGIMEHLKTHWSLGNDKALLADHHLGKEFEANRRWYYIVLLCSANLSSKKEIS